MAVQPRADWLERASRVQMCPLCLATGQYESDYLDALCDRLVDDDRDVVTGAALEDLCAEHMSAFASASHDAGLGFGAALRAHLGRLDDLADRLAELGEDGWLTMPECGLCLGRNELTMVCANRLLGGLARRGNPAAPHLREAGGLCATHFSVCWETTSDGVDRDTLRRIQLEAVQRLAEIARSGEGSDDRDPGRLHRLTARATAITSM